MSYICDNCGKPMAMMDDDSFYCYYCGQISSPIVDESNYEDREEGSQNGSQI